MEDLFVALIAVIAVAFLGCALLMVGAVYQREQSGQARCNAVGLHYWDARRQCVEYVTVP